MEDATGLFISSDMFYVEIVLFSDGTVMDVKVHHECKVRLFIPLISKKIT